MTGIRRAGLGGLLLVSLAAPSAAQRPTDTSPHRVKFVTVSPGVRLEVLDWGGRGPAMLFLAGLDDTGHEFDDFAPRWVGRFHVLALTRRGFGASSRPATGYQIDSLAGDIRTALDSLGIARAVLVGHSLAGDEITRFAAAWPDRVIRLVYLDAAHDRVPLARMFRELPVPAPSPMTASDSASPDGVREYTRRTSGVRLTMGEILSIARFGPDGRYLRDITPPTVDSAILAGLEHPRYARVRAPALALYAVPDSAPQLFAGYAALDSAGQAAARRFFAAFSAWARDERARFKREVVHGRTVELAGAHHYLFISNPDEVVRAMSDFLR